VSNTSTQPEVLLSAWRWNAGQEPEVFQQDSDIFRLQQKVYDTLEDHYDFAKIGHPTREVYLFYQVVTDPFRGRTIIAASDEGGLEERRTETLEKFKRHVYTPNELYALKGVCDFDLDNLETWLKLDNVDFSEYGTTLGESPWSRIAAERRVKVRALTHTWGYSDEWWFIGTLWFDDKPIAVLTHTGECGVSRFITDPLEFSALIAYIRSFAPKADPQFFVVAPDKPLADLTEFDDYNVFEEHYDVVNQQKIEKLKTR
jgi:hypothetical protein